METGKMPRTGLSSADFSGISLSYDQSTKSVIVGFEADEVPSCTMRIVRSLHLAYDHVVRVRSSGLAIQQLLLTSKMDAIFNMGGDLALIARAARARDRDLLHSYGSLTASLVHRTWDGLGVHLTTMSVVDGDAFGGGFEAALSANIVVASERSRFAFPEVRFGLYPGMGATSLIGRRASPALATSLIEQGRVINAKDAAALGLVDWVTEQKGEQLLLRFLRMHPHASLRFAEISRLRRLQAAYYQSEAQIIVEQWVEAVMNASERTILHIERIVKAQKARVGRSG